MVQVVEGKGPADLARDMDISISNFTQWKERGVSLRQVLGFVERHSISLDWLLFGKKPLEDERGGEWIGLEDLNRDQRNLISVIRQDRLLARTLMMLYGVVISRVSNHREAIEAGITLPYVAADMKSVAAPAVHSQSVPYKKPQKKVKTEKEIKI